MHKAHFSQCTLFLYSPNHLKARGAFLSFVPTEMQRCVCVRVSVCLCAYVNAPVKLGQWVGR